ncbi:rod shape-determining protein MreD [Mesobacillus maritimus]|uniref:rod shape-determining protein MreD n=1 Tax=Mesobacillus maritimus TaxID=1643336 RepID=UPI00203F986D|nr:rod shape-determining protein MreD [Mesobacillus maritimus]MCM3669916.1 rod shape-determining protein MreD [Mesobacillus maritimus]
MKRFLVPLLLTLLFVIEGLFAQLLPANLFNGDYILVPRLLIMAIFFLTIYGSVKHGIIYGFVYGLLFDMVYTEIIGVYLFLFPLTTYFFLMIMKVVQTHILVVSFVSLISIAALEAAVYGMNLLIHIADIDFTSFTEIRLVPTLALNLIFVILFAYPFKKQFEKFADRLRND